ncbi:hypothetical protein ACV3Z6_01935 [Clostridium perfringens]|uniref:hypothetical protein n=1 Tax=Clostridium perfringens TaxID=1502 RepID=UPI00109431D2|nr:hypothetical protein [Clostridium perfringens]MCX0354532.1 hypothetical protein [Clostridium perfringens]MDM0616355.1 hypothetical protein [Clostridium perfringens]MDT7987041.1 hypothetical protein [Clostridium perfringens]WEV23189.1 hypothetical protein PL327_05760 [Clostridium perfringens D]WVM61642.1 hypothetical protein V1657_05180 [Clostridium perfringens]
MFGDLITNSKVWDINLLGEVCEMKAEKNIKLDLNRLSLGAAQPGLTVGKIKEFELPIAQLVCKIILRILLNK